MAMDDQLLDQWRTLLCRQQELVREYLMAVGRDHSPQLLGELRSILGVVANDVEMLRRLLPLFPAES